MTSLIIKQDIRRIRPSEVLSVEYRYLLNIFSDAIYWCDFFVIHVDFGLKKKQLWLNKYVELIGNTCQVIPDAFFLTTNLD